MARATSSTRGYLVRHVPFPATIRALPHVLKTIDEMLMSFEEALVAAARIKDGGWVLLLLRRYEFPFKNECLHFAAMCAAANNQDEVAKRLIHDLVTAPSAVADSEDDAGRDARVVILKMAFKSGNYDFVKSLTRTVAP
ncbi:hypothetical protein PHYSODRAFT_340528 [Phytophthora sojae]|uniref:Uncharacterized protein n=1 Tax=Phytophthora sojae (strain P6497) TaxID=1094619 RepID=G5AA10_PHYSP|nr:hypothetical protein PHYSODRAFT_340528 [Phytophthora sojae]EGZ07439.1 hypothetical protein PHYSODRAFT_340528 [Phytophthora sojae]|eukprot:XP_009537005.1 hypothetical protein PHYSODRAFT_340528 [Phytophthora sojae]